jgi:hypothetical protein
MAQNASKTVVVQTNTGNRNWKQVNIVASAVPKGGKGHNQVPIAQNTLRQYPIVQPTASTVAGLATVYIAGYSGPS